MDQSMISFFLFKFKILFIYLIYLMLLDKGFLKYFIELNKKKY